MVKTQKTKKSIPPCVKWLNFLNEALEADRVKIISLQKFFGYCVSDQITSSLMDSINPFRYFTSECLEISETPDGCYEETTELWYAYSEWCKQGHNRPLGRNKFFEQVLATFMRVRKGREIIKVEGKDKYLSVFYNLRLTEAGRNYASQGRRRAEKY